MNISALKILLKENGSRLAHQTLDGMNWKQVTYNDIYSNIEYINSYLTKNKIINRLKNKGFYWDDIQDVIFSLENK